MWPFTRSPAGPRLQPGDATYLSPLDGAHLMQASPVALYAVYMIIAALVAMVAWASVSNVDIIAVASARIVPDGREQVIASLEGGILRDLMVREGQQVSEGQELALLDPTRFEAQKAEGQAKRTSLRGAVARLQAEAAGLPLQFPPEVEAAPAVVQGERESYNARLRAMNEAVESNRRSVALLQRELGVAEAMSAKGLMSEVEVMRVRRQVNDLNLQTQERINRFRQDASAELVRVRTELSMLEEQMVVKDDALRRTMLISPVRGVVKTIRMNTVGGVVPPGSPVMEIMPVGPRVLVEARVKPADIGFVKVGQHVVVKLQAFEYNVYGGLQGTVDSISPDAIADERAGAEAGYYRALIRAEQMPPRPGKAPPKPLSVLPGMTATVEIRTGQRSVLGFVLRPMLKTSEAFRER
jgi:adhesin transport system membrane fusion protein